MTKFGKQDTPPSFADVAGYIAKSVVAIAIGLRSGSGEPDIVGTGFSVGLSEYYATCCHVIQKYDELSKLSQTELAKRGLIDNNLRVAVPIGTNHDYEWREIQHSAWFRGESKDSDTCVLRLVGISIPSLALSNNEFVWGSEVGIVGFPLGKFLQGDQLRPFVLKSVISGGIDPTSANGFKTGHLALGTSVAGGFSGGPVFSVVDGRVIGMIASKVLEPSKLGGKWPAGISLAVGPEDLHNVLGATINSMTAKKIDNP